MPGSSLIETCLQAVRQQSFIKAYEQTFDVVPAADDAHRESAFRLRYAVLCEENGYEHGRGRGLEYDAFDNRARHFLLIHRETGETVGTTRVLLPDDDHPGRSFPLQELCDHPLLHMEDRVQTLCEISKMCMSRRFRKRMMDGTMLPAYYDQDVIRRPGILGALKAIRRRIPYAPLGLFRAAFEAAMAARITDCVMALEPDHLTSLARAGLAYRTLGPRLSLHGQQQPIVFNIKAVLDNMAESNSHCWEVISDRGRLHHIANELNLNDWHDRIIDESCREMIYRKLSGFEE